MTKLIRDAVQQRPTEQDISRFPNWLADNNAVKTCLEAVNQMVGTAEGCALQCTDDVDRFITGDGGKYVDERLAEVAL